jgi:hypothetical protein
VPCGGIIPVQVATAAPAVGDTLTGAGYGQTATDWTIGALHTGSFAVT